MKLSEIRNILREEDIQLTKSLGQNFLHDQHQLQKIVALAQIKPDDKILEILNDELHHSKELHDAMEMI